MRSQRQPVDVLLFIEYVARELDVACALKSLIRQRHGLTLEIASLYWDLGRTLARYQPNVVALPYCYSASPDDPGHSQMLSVWPQAVYVNLAYEQVFQRINEGFKMPRDLFAHHHVLYQAWGEFYAARLRACGVPAAHISINGNPTYALYRPPYRAFFPSRQMLASQHGLDPAKRWVFVPENYGAAFLSNRSLQDHIRRGYEVDAAHQYRAFARASLREAITWWNQAGVAGPIELIVRPRPMTPLSTFQMVCRQVLGRAAAQSFHIIKAGTVREWVLASDAVFSSYSTTLIEAAIARKSVAMIAPVLFPTFVQAEWYALLPQLATARQFIESAIEGLPDGSWRRLNAWAEERMFPDGDPIHNSADWLAGIVRQDRVRPPPLTLSQRSQRPWVSPLHRCWRAFVNQRLHEQDRLIPAMVDCRCIAWAQTLSHAPAATAQQELAHA